MSLVVAVAAVAVVYLSLLLVAADMFCFDAAAVLRSWVAVITMLMLVDCSSYFDSLCHHHCCFCRFSVTVVEVQL